MTDNYQTYTTSGTICNADTDAAFDAFWLAPFCPTAGADAQGYAERLQALWHSAAARRTGDTYITETVECLLAEGVRFERIDRLGLAHKLTCETAFA